MILTLEWIALFTGFTGALWIIARTGEQGHRMLQRNRDGTSRK